MAHLQISDLTPAYRHIYISPHFDDAVLSCGGSLALQRRGRGKALVVTVCAGVPPVDLALSPFAAAMHEEWKAGVLSRRTRSATQASVVDQSPPVSAEGRQDTVTGASVGQQAPGPATEGSNPERALNAEAIVAIRRAEDTAALNLLGVDHLWLDCYDAIYRGMPPLYTDDSRLFGRVLPGDSQMESTLVARLQQLREKAPEAVFYAPLGVGQHVDHQVCFQAARILQQQGATLRYYEDLPYAARNDAVERRKDELSERLEVSMWAEQVDIGSVLEAKLNAISAYSSQVDKLCGGEKEMAQVISSYASSLGHPSREIYLERYWRVR